MFLSSDRVRDDYSDGDEPSNLHAMREDFCSAAWVMSTWNQSFHDDVIDFDAVHRLASFQVVVNVLVAVPLCLGGFAGNIVSIIVLRMDKINTNLSFLLQALAVADNAYLVGCMLFQTLRTVTMATNWFPDSVRDAYQRMEPFVWPLASVAQTASVWLVVVVTLDRYLAIRRAIRSSDLTTAPLTSAVRVRGAVVAVFAVALVYNIPGFFELRTYTIRCENATATMTVSGKTALRRDRIYFAVYETAAYFLFRLGVPLAVVSFLNVRLVVATRCVRTKLVADLKRHGTHRDRGNVTLLLVSMVTVFIVCELPDFILRVVLTIFYITDQPTETLSVHYWTTMTNLMLTINSSTNCLVYCLSGRQFRRILRRHVLRCCYGTEPGTGTVGTRGRGRGETLTSAGSTGFFTAFLVTSSQKNRRKKSLPCSIILEERGDG